MVSMKATMYRKNAAIGTLYAAPDSAKPLLPHRNVQSPNPIRRSGLSGVSSPK